MFDRTLDEGVDSQQELNDSKAFLGEVEQLHPKLSVPLKKDRALELSPTFGVATRAFLLDQFKEVEILMPRDSTSHTERLERRNGHKVTQLYQGPLQSFSPDKNRYNIIWNQWTLHRFTDREVVEYLIKMGNALIEGGFIIIKEKVYIFNLLGHQNLTRMN